MMTPMTRIDLDARICPRCGSTMLVLDYGRRVCRDQNGGFVPVWDLRLVSLACPTQWCGLRLSRR